MSKETKQTLIRGLTFFLGGLIGLNLQTNDQGLSGYFLLLFGIWEIGDVIANYFFNEEVEYADKEKSRKEIMKKFKVDVARTTIPMVLSMMAELVISDPGIRVHTITAYLVVLVIYLFFIGLFTFFELKEAPRLKAKKTRFTIRRFVNYERK